MSQDSKETKRVFYVIFIFTDFRKEVKGIMIKRCLLKLNAIDKYLSFLWMLKICWKLRYRDGKLEMLEVIFLE